MRGIDIEPRALAKIIALGIGNTLTAGAGVRRDENDPVLGTGRSVFALFGDVGVGAGEAG